MKKVTTASPRRYDATFQSTLLVSCRGHAWPPAVRQIDHEGLLWRRVDERQRRSAMFSIDQEIGIQRQDGMTIMDFRHTNDACIGQGHRRIPVFLKQFAQCTDMLIDPECDAQRPVSDKL
jgi:hypothetical protein